MPTGFSITATSTFPKGVLSPKQIRAYILNAALRTGRDMETHIASITDEWRHTVPRDKKPKIRYAGGDALVSIHIYDEVFWYLNDGTDERWAVMGTGFTPKTRVGILKSGSGAGNPDPVMRGRRHMKAPKPGIEARNWVVLIEGRTEIDLKRRIDEAIQKSLKLGP